MAKLSEIIQRFQMVLEEYGDGEVSYENQHKDWCPLEGIEWNLKTRDYFIW